MDTTNTTTVTAEILSQLAQDARECKAGYGQAYIADCWRVWRAWGNEGSLAAFKRAIVVDAGCRAQLARIDIASALDIAAQAESEATYGTWVVHVVNR